MKAADPRPGLALTGAEAILAAIVQSSDDAILSKDLNGVVTSWNPAAERIFGYSAAEIVGNSIQLVIPADRADEEREFLRRVRLGERIDHCETRRQRKDGSLIDVSVTISPLCGDGGAVAGASTVARDITEQKRLTTARARLAAIVESSDDAIVAKDLNGIVTSWNQAAERIFGYTAEEMIGKPIALLVPPDRPDEEPAILERLRRGERTDHFETERVRKDGGRILVSVTISPIRDRSGSVVGASKVARDVTAERQLRAELSLRSREIARQNDALRRTNAALEQADRQRSHFLSMLAHELRNPLAPIRNSLELIRRDPEPGRVERARLIIGRQVNHLVRMVDDLLDVTRITHGRISLVRERVDLANLAQVHVSDQQPAATAAGLQLTLTTPEHPVRVAGDPTRLVQILDNLVDNAIKFTPAGGSVSVSVRQEAERALLSVTDTGSGIEADLLPYLFDVFAQADRSLERTRGGLGLGLSIARGLAQLHGGSLSARSAGPGRGAEFILELPIAADAQAPAPGNQASRNQAPAEGPAAALRVLVVEDNRDAADTLADLLMLNGYEVQTVYSGLEAVDAAARFRPQVVLCDIGLPGLDGYGVAARLRQDPRVWKARLIAVTGYGAEEDRRRARQAGFDAHLVKPVNTRELLQHLRPLQ